MIDLRSAGFKTREEAAQMLRRTLDAMAPEGNASICFDVDSITDSLIVRDDLCPEAPYCVLLGKEFEDAVDYYSYPWI